MHTWYIRFSQDYITMRLALSNELIIESRMVSWFSTEIRILLARSHWQINLFLFTAMTQWHVSACSLVCGRQQRIVSIFAIVQSFLFTQVWVNVHLTHFLPDYITMRLVLSNVLLVEAKLVSWVSTAIEFCWPQGIIDRSNLGDYLQWINGIFCWLFGTHW